VSDRRECLEGRPFMYSTIISLSPPSYSETVVPGTSFANKGQAICHEDELLHNMSVRTCE